jgi:glycosyltransferase involved in cell wall biosynthesis
VRLAIVNHLGNVGAGAEHALLQFLVRLPDTIEPMFFFFEDGEFAQSMRERFGSVTIVPMPKRVATVERGRLSTAAIPQGAALAWRLAWALRAAAPDLVLTNSMKAHVIGSLAAKLVGLRCINYVHDLVTGPALALLRTISRTCAVERLTCSKAVAESLALPRTTPVYAPIDTRAYRDLPQRKLARAAMGLPDDGLAVVALVGRIARWKGQDRFIRIAADVLRDTDAHFIIVGSPLFGCDPRFEPELAAAVAGFGLQHRIHFVPWQEDMRTVYGAADLVCNCSTSEPFGRTALEGLAAGIPIVCFDDAGVCEILDQQPGAQGGICVPAGDEIEFARAVRSYLRDAQLSHTAGRMAQICAQRCDIENVYKTFIDILVRVGRAPAMSHSQEESRALSPLPSSIPR